MNQSNNVSRLNVVDIEQVSSGIWIWNLIINARQWIPVGCIRGSVAGGPQDAVIVRTGRPYKSTDNICSCSVICGRRPR